MSRTVRSSINAQPTRRAVVAGGLAVICVPLVGETALATPAEMADAVRELTRGQPPKRGRVTLELPELAENGNTVALSVTIASPMSDVDHVTSISIFSELNPIATIARFFLTPRAGPNPTVKTNIRLADSQRVTAVAAMSDGSFWSGDANVVVTVAACIDGG